MSALQLEGLTGSNPLGFLAALGALDVLGRMSPAADPRLSWTPGLVPHAVLTGVDDVEALAAAIDDDRQRWRGSVLLGWGDLQDVKLDPGTLRRWASALVSDGEPADAALFSALLAEGAVAGKGDSKPTHLHFTAGQQRFLMMVRELSERVTPQDLREALHGPWTYASRLPSLSWDARGERIYALRGTDPAGEKRGGVPGADWLAFLGLSFFPVVAKGTALRTTACSPGWKRGRFRWPLWAPGLRPATIRSLLRDPTLRRLDPEYLQARGVTQLLESPIRRSEQGGYGSFGPAAQVERERRPPGAAAS